MASPIELKLNKKKAQLSVSMAYADFMTQSQQAIIGIEQIERKGKALGWSNEQLEAAILPQAERLRTAAKMAISAVATKGGALGYMQSKADGNLDAVFRWQSVGGPSVCVDCEDLHGKEMAYSEWLASNMPGDGQTICGGRCRCALVPVAEWTDEPLLTGKE